jgi:uncharacterized glyoxalase superfamily protein PhnB
MASNVRSEDTGIAGTVLTKGGAMAESAQVFYPSFRYRDARAAIDWLVDALHERAKAAGAEVVMEPMDTDYGSRDFAIRDPEGNLWNFGTYRP